ncbi:hypothetical protein H2202_004662 [Exophiala xenobiotica]|nr:hypothetical protein H2202_004662 [Exophiala xenobiotica]
MPKTRRVAQLEERINNLTSLLTSNKSPRESPNSPSSIPCAQSLLTPSISITRDAGPLAQPSTTLEVGNNASLALQRARPAANDGATANADIKTFFRTELAPVVEEKLFSDFRTSFNQYFPYVIIPPQATTAYIRASKPFLFRTCIAVASHADPLVQRQIAEELLRYIGERMLLKAEKSLDILQGILVFISWYQYYNLLNPQLMNLLHLASAMTIDLGLNRPSHVGPWPPTGIVIDTNQLIHGKPVRQGIQTSDERRALLGLYFFTANLSASFKSLDFMQWTQHLDDCCTSLTVAAEYPSDVEAVQAVQLTRMLDRYSPYTGAISPKHVPIKTFIRCFQEDLQRIKQGLPASLAENKLFNMQLLSAELAIFEIVATSEQGAPLERAQALHMSLGTIDSLIDLFSKLPASTLPHLTFLTWVHILHCCILSAKLSFLVVDGWDLQYVLGTLEAAVRQSMGESQTPNAVSARYTVYAEKMRLCAKRYDNKIRAETESRETTSEAGPALPSFDPTFEGFFEGVDDGFWTDFNTDWATAGIQF